MQLQGIHHISAITGDAQRNLDFYTRVLGLRLVAKTVNQDDPSVYHLFYADEQGHPGSEMTFFEYPHAIPGRPGAGMIHRIVWRVGSEDALAFWAERLPLLEVSVTRGDQGSVVFSDPEGLEHELVVNATGDAPLVAVLARHPGRSTRCRASTASAPTRPTRRARARCWSACSARRGPARPRGPCAASAAAAGSPTTPRPPSAAASPAARVHHVAWGTTVAEHPRWQDRITEAGVHTSGIIDRTYFKSIYFREPSGVLFEIADDAPGFTIDSPVEELGRKIILPPQFEAQREKIEQRLTPLPDPGPRPDAAAAPAS